MHNWKLQFAGHEISTSMSSQSVYNQEVTLILPAFVFIFYLYSFSVDLHRFTKRFFCIFLSPNILVIKSILRLFQVFTISKILRWKVYRDYLTTETKHSCRSLLCTISNNNNKKALFTIVLNDLFYQQRQF